MCALIEDVVMTFGGTAGQFPLATPTGVPLQLEAGELLELQVLVASTGVAAVAVSHDAGGQDLLLAATHPNNVGPSQPAQRLFLSGGKCWVTVTGNPAILLFRRLRPGGCRG